MSISDWYTKKIKKLNMWDIGVIKNAAFLFGVIVGAYIPVFVKANVGIIIAIIMVLVAMLLYKVFKK